MYYFTANTEKTLAVDGGLEDGASVKLVTKNTSDVNVKVRQLWKIKYLGDGYYSIRSLYKADKCIQRTVGSTALLTVGPGDYVANFPSDALWKIESVGTGYLLQNCWTPVAKQCLKATASSTSVNTYSTGDNSFVWTLTADTSVQDMLLLIDTNTALPVTNPAKTICGFGTTDLDELDLVISFISQTTNEQYAIGWESSNTSVATVNSSSGAVTPRTSGTAVIKASHPRANNTVRYTVTVPPSYSVNLDVIYDKGHAERYSNSAAEIEPHLETLQRIYWEEFGININYSTPTLFESYADLCSNGAYELCDCDNRCQNSYAELDDEGNVEITHYIYHHKNVKNVLYALRLPDVSQTLRMAFSGHNLCIATDKGCKDYALGLAQQELGIAVVENAGNNDAAKTAIHEFGHLYGAKDHYGGEYPTTAKMNEDMTEPNDSVRYSESCIYGEGRDELTVGDDNLFCEGCRRDIEANRDQYEHS